MHYILNRDMRSSNQQNIIKYVDGYFLPHFPNHAENHQYRHESTNNAHPYPPSLQQSPPTHQNTHSNDTTRLNQHDIDRLQLMNPRMTPEQYMKNIRNYYNKEKNLRFNNNTHSPLSNHRKRLKETSKQLQHSEHVYHEEQNDDEEAHLNQLRDACYIGLGKKIVARKQGEKTTPLGKANYYTRQYLLPRVIEEVTSLQTQNADNRTRKYYLIANANSKGINFQVERMPSEFTQIMQLKTYREIVSTINSIIQNTVYLHKTETNLNKKINPLYFWLSLALFAIMILLTTNSQTLKSPILQTVSLMASLCLIVFILMLSCHHFHQPLQYVSLIDQIDHKITDYLNYLNSQPHTTLSWKTTNNLYWLQITPVQ